MTQQLISPVVLDLIPISDVVSLGEVAVPADFVGKSLKHLDLRNRMKVAIVAIRRFSIGIDEAGNTVRNERVVFPDAYEVLDESDVLIIVGMKESLDLFKDLQVTMIIIRRRHLILLAVVVGATFLAFGWYGYHLADRMTGGGEEMKLLGEKLLIVGIVAAIILVFLIFMILRLSTNLERRLDRLIDQGRARGILPGRDFVGMGPLGDKLTALFNLLSRLNDQKTRKISSMQGLAIQHLAFLLLKTRKPVDDVAGKIQYTCYPIMDKTDESAYLVFLIGVKSGYQEYGLAPAVSRNNSANTISSGLNKIRSGLGIIRAGFK